MRLLSQLAIVCRHALRLCLLSQVAIAAPYAYVDATPDNTTLNGAALVDGGNCVNNGTNPAGSGTDGQWTYRTDSAVANYQGGTAFESDNVSAAGDAEDTAPLVTTIIFPVVGTYEIVAVFATNSNRDIAARIGSAPTTSHVYTAANALNADQDLVPLQIEFDDSFSNARGSDVGAADLGLVTTTTPNQAVQIYINGLASTAATDDERTQYEGIGHRTYEPVHRDIFLLAGQSNADGRALKAELTGGLAEYAGQQAGVRIHYTNPAYTNNDDYTNPDLSRYRKWMPLEPGYSKAPGYNEALLSPTFGQEIGAAKVLTTYYPSPAFIKVTQGGTKLTYPGVEWYPAPLDSPDVGPLYEELIESVQMALAELEAVGDTYTIHAMFWHQGESDSNNNRTSQYNTRLPILIERVRIDLGLPNLRFIIGELADTYSQTFRNVQWNVSRAAPNAGFLSSRGLITSDNVHFDTASMITFGERLGHAFLPVRDVLDFEVPIYSPGALHRQDGCAATGGFSSVLQITATASQGEYTGGQAAGHKGPSGAHYFTRRNLLPLAGARSLQADFFPGDAGFDDEDDADSSLLVAGWGADSNSDGQFVDAESAIGLGLHQNGTFRIQIGGTSHLATPFTYQTDRWYRLNLTWSKPDAGGQRIVNLFARDLADGTDLNAGEAILSINVASADFDGDPSQWLGIGCRATRGLIDNIRTSFTVIPADTTPPVITVPDPVIAEATGPDGAIVNYSVTAEDLVDANPVVVVTPATGSQFPLGETTVNVTATDDEGNESSASFTVTVVDTTAPDLTLPEDIVAEATSATGAVVNYSVSALDLVDGAGVPNSVPASGSTFPLGSTTVNVDITDAAGNQATDSFTITVADTTPPVITVPDPVIAEATGPSGAIVNYSVSAVDLVDANPVVVVTPASVSQFPLGETLVIVTATDDEGNQSGTSFTVTVVDTTPPELTLPADLVAEATSATGAVVNFSVSSLDLVDGAGVPSAVPASGSTFPPGITTVNVDITDAAGNEATGSFTITVEDTTPPVISVPDPVIAEATGPSGAIVNFSVTAEDLVDAEPVVVVIPDTGSQFPLGKTTVNVTATDDEGNESSTSLTVTVVDTTPPELTLPADMVAEATSPTGAVVNFSVNALDLVDGAGDPNAAPASGSVFPLGITTVNVALTDAAGNQATGSFTITIEDTTSPVISVPDPVMAEATGPDGAIVNYSVSAVDLVDAEPLVVVTPASGSQFPLGETTVNVTATDDEGNESSTSFTVTVVDTTPPELTVPADLVAEATSATGAVVNFSVSSLDLVDGAGVPNAVPASGSTFPPGSTTVNVGITDAAGNVATGSFTITVEDTTPPVINVPDPVIAEATGPGGAIVNFSVSALDLVDANPVFVVTPASGSQFALGETLITVTATDDQSNSTGTSFTVTVVDTTAPALTLPADLVAEATSATGAVVNFSVSALDLVDGAGVPNAVPASGSTFPPGLTTVNVDITDAAGNQATGSFTITVQDSTAPVISVPDPIIAEATGPNGAIVIYSVTAEDLVDAEPVVVVTPAAGSQFPLGGTTVNVTATDDEGNQSSTSFTVTVVDTTAPELTLPEDIVAEATSATGAVFHFSVTATDLVDGELQPLVNPPSGSFFQVGVTTVLISITDAAGNNATGSFDVIVTPPVTLAYASVPVIIPANGLHGAKFSAAVTGPAGALVKFESSTGLGISDEWDVIGQITLDETGDGAFTEVEAPHSVGEPSIFFRLRMD